MISMNLFPELLMIITILLFILDIANRGTGPIKLANMNFFPDIMVIITILLFILDIVTKGKYRTRPVALTTLSIGLIIGIIYVLAVS